MKKLLLSGCLLLAYVAAISQPKVSISLEQCYLLAQQHYPLAKQSGILTKSREFSLENISKTWYPQVGLNAQASYQSAVTEVPVKLPNVNIESPSKDQYKAFADLYQPLYDGGLSRQQKAIVDNIERTEQQKLDVELYKLKERLNLVYFGILLIDEQREQLQIVKKDIQSGINKVQGAVDNGAALKSSVDVLKAELLKTDQQETALHATRKAYLAMLGLFINQQLNQDVTLSKPNSPAKPSSIKRPELSLFESQKLGSVLQENLITARNKPRLGVFVQAGFGKPALNFLKNEFEPYYVAGLRVSWTLSGLYTEKNERQQQKLNRRMIDIQHETFLFNTNISLSQQAAEIDKLQELISKDDEIIRLRSSIKKTAQAQLDYGTITSNDYLREVNAEDQARQNLLLHQMQLLMAQYSYQFTTGNW